MNYSGLDVNSLRIEIAILQEDILSNNPGTAKFKIPVIMTDDTISRIIASGNKNIINRRNGNISGFNINIENTILLRIPLEYTYFYGKKIIPSGTKFLVAFVGGNINDIRIIGRYDFSDKDIPYDELDNIEIISDGSDMLA